MTAPSSVRFLSVLRVLAMAGLASLLIPPLTTLHAATGTHLEESTLYPRLLRLTHGPRALRGTILAKTGNHLFRSTDDGRTFAPLATVPTGGETALAKTPDGHSRERCCSTIYELSRRVGHLSAGTLLYAGSFLSGDEPAIEIFVSRDGGAHWTYSSTPLRAGDRKHGLWEPEFTIAREGSLIMFVSDETQSCCSQKLVQQRTRDGQHWSRPSDIVASHDQRDRPGMAVVSKLPEGTYFMSYEICGPTYHCAVFSRIGRDGSDFGNPEDPGTRIETADGEYLAHAPSNIFAPSAQLGHGGDHAHDGLQIVAGQMLLNRDGSVSPSNGKVLLVRSVGEPGAAWRTAPAPVEVPSAYDNYCPNYSSALLTNQDGNTVLELASDYDSAHHCTSFFATAPLR